MTCERRGTGKQIEHLFGLAEELRGVFLCHRLFPPYVVRRLNAGQPSESVFLNNKGRSVGGEGDLVRNFPHHSPCCYWNHCSFRKKVRNFPQCQQCGSARGPGTRLWASVIRGCGANISCLCIVAFAMISGFY